MLALMSEVNIKELINEFVDSNIEDLESEGALCLDMCEMENDFSMVAYWISGTYTEVENFILKNKDNIDFICKEIINMYERKWDMDKLKEKFKLRGIEEFSTAFLARECLASIMLKEYQRSSIWYTVYGSEEEDMIDFQKYNIVSALNNPEDFPVMKLSDISAAMLGINYTVQPSDLYDVFAHLADKLAPSQEDLISTKEPIFTPDVIEYEAVVSRHKYFMDIKRNIEKNKNVDLFEYTMNIGNLKELDRDFKKLGIANSYETGIANYLKDEYLNKFNSPPYSFPLLKDRLNVSFDEDSDSLKIIFNIRGICNCNNEYREILNTSYKVPRDATEFQKILIEMVTDIKKELSGLEKEKGDNGEKAIEGKYMRKNLATHGLKLSNISLKLAEKQSLYIIKKSLRYLKNPEVSCSFGIDSTLVLYLMRKVTKNNFKVLFNNTGVEYSETIDFKKKLLKEWNLQDNLIEARPEKGNGYWDYLEKYDWNFERKGSRKVNENGSKSSRSEICCKWLKHVPTQKAIDMYKFDGCFSGLRASESRARDQSAKRDGNIYVSKTWKSVRVNPIQHFTDDMVWNYVRENNIPYSKIYDYILYDDDGNVIYKPRTGCSTCLITAQYGYLRFLKQYKPKLFWFLMKEKGLGRKLLAISMGVKDTKIKVKNFNSGQISMFNNIDTSSSANEVSRDQYTLEKIENMSWDQIETIIDYRPCRFEKALQDM